MTQEPDVIRSHVTRLMTGSSRNAGPAADGGGTADGVGLSPAARERRLIEEAQLELHREFPWLSTQQVNVVVECVWAEFAGARVRDFVPVLVRKQAREELRDQFSA